MSSVQEANVGTTPVRTGFELDEHRLSEWLTAHVEGFSGPLRLEQFRGGQSNPTYKIITPQRSYVLRKKPSGVLLKGAHAIEREAAVLEALEPVGFPVAHLYGLCEDESVIGASFYVMDCVEGRVFWDATLPQVSRAERASYFDALNQTIAQLHTVDYEAVGLGSFGRPGNYFERQIGRWTKQYLADEEAGRDPNMDRVIEWLPRHIPAGDETSIVHGDFRCDNVIFHPQEPRVVAVLDWELSTLGHPLADFIYHAMMYRMPPRYLAGLVGSDLAALGIPSEAEYIEAYCRRTGRESIPALDFYFTFSFFRIAAIFHGIKGRVLRGTAASASARERAESFPALAELAWQQAQRAMTNRR